MRAATESLSALIFAPSVLRSSGAMRPSVDRSSEIEPFLPSAATRTASSAASQSAASILAMNSDWRLARSVMRAGSVSNERARFCHARGSLSRRGLPRRSKSRLHFCARAAQIEAQVVAGKAK